MARLDRAKPKVNDPASRAAATGIAEELSGLGDELVKLARSVAKAVMIFRQAKIEEEETGENMPLFNETRERIGAGRAEGGEEMVSEWETAGSVYSVSSEIHPLNPDEVNALARGTSRLELQETIIRGIDRNEMRACKASGPKPPRPRSAVWSSVAAQLEADPHVTMSGARKVYNMARVLVEEWADIRGAMERFVSDTQGLQFVLGEVEYPRAREQAKRTLQRVRRGEAARRAQLMVRLRREAGHISFSLIRQAVDEAR